MMPENETVAQKMLRAMDAAIDDGNYEAVGRLAVTFHEMVPKDAWARRGLTDAEADVAEEIVAKTDEPEPLKFGQWVQGGGGVGIVLEYNSAEGLYRVWWKNNDYGWCSREEITPIEPQS